MKMLLFWLLVMLAWNSSAEEHASAFVFYTEDYPPFSFMARDQVSGLNTNTISAINDILEQYRETGVIDTLMQRYR